jgi:RND family efflux transporter MFP subunit
VRIALADEPEFSREGTIDFVDNRIDQGTGTMRGRGVFANADHALVPGLFVRVRLIGQTIPNAVLVPDAAIGADQANRVVFTVDEKNIVQQRTVVPGKLFEGLRIIQSGLDGTERVVVGGVQRARPGATVAPEMVEIAVKPAASMPAPPAAGAGR